MRGTRTYGQVLKSDWYESDTTTSLWANAAVVAAAALGADLSELAHKTMAAAMRDGGLLGRREVAVSTVAQLAGVDAGELDRRIDHAATGEALNAGNAALAQWGCTERPSWRLENANGDFVVTHGVWQKDALLGVARALKADEAAYAAAGAPPV